MSDFRTAKEKEAKRWKVTHSPYAPKPRIIRAMLNGDPLPVEPLVFG